MRSLYALVWRDLTAHKLRNILAALAIALGVAMTIAADVVSGAILNALSGSEDAETFLLGLLDQLDRMLVLIGVMVTAVAGFLVYNAFAMAVTQRRRQIGALRSLGMARHQVMRLMLVEALAIGAAGTLLGVIAGPLLGQGTIALMKAMMGEGIFVFAGSRASVSILGLAAALGMGVTLLSVLVPARRATGVSPLVALQRETAAGIEPSPVRRGLLGMLVVGPLVAYLVASPPGEWVESPWDARLTVLAACLWLGGLALILPALVGAAGRWVRRPLAHLWGASGRLAADNLRRGRGRVALTILTLAAGLTMIVGTTGLIRFVSDELMRPKLEGVTRLGGWIVAQFDYMEGMSAYAGKGSLELSPEVVAAVRQAAQGRAEVLGWYFVVVPELSFFGDSYFSFVLEPRGLQQAGDRFFTFTEGSWETAIPIMESGCGVLLAPSVASKNDTTVGAHFQVTGAGGPVECTAAGIGSPYVGASVIGLAAGESFGIVDGVSQPLILVVWPQAGEDRDALGAGLEAVVGRHPGTTLSEMEVLADLQVEVSDRLPTMFSALLLLAIVAAGLGVVNTTLISVAERQRELGLLRAVGATRRQVMAVVAGEAALMGLLGGLLGLVAGTGITAILAVTYGGNGWGLPGLDLWPAAWRSMQPALLNGLVGLLIAPFICAGAAWLPARSILRSPASQTIIASAEGGASPDR